MSVRPFDIRDLNALRRHRNQCLFLDSTRLLTNGPKLVSMGNLFYYLSNATGVYTYLVKQDGASCPPLIGQVVHTHGSSAARLTFLTPQSAVLSSCLPEIIDELTHRVGERGALNLIAEVDENDPSFEALRKAGFAIYARQRIWSLPGNPDCDCCPTDWRPGISRDVIDVRSLYCNLVPNLVQQVEPSPARLRGMINRDKGELRAYVELRYGPRGIWAQPFIHPDLDQLPQRLSDLIAKLAYRRERPVYLCVRSYQSWLEPAIEDLGALAGPRQALLVKRLAKPVKATQPVPVHALERGRAEISTPMAQSKVNLEQNSSARETHPVQMS
jgi:hypothetical protein